MSTTKLHEYIYNIEISEIQAELDVMEQMSNTYCKAANILEYYNGNDLSSFKIFNDDYENNTVIQEGKIMDDVKKQGEGKSVLNKIFFFIPRLLKSLVKFLTGQLKDDKQSKIQNQIKQNKQRRSKLSKEQKILALKLAGIPILVGGTIYAGSKVIKVSQKALEDIKQKKNNKKNKDNNKDKDNEITQLTIEKLDEVINAANQPLPKSNQQTSIQVLQSKQKLSDQTSPTPPTPPTSPTPQKKTPPTPPTSPTPQKKTPPTPPTPQKLSQVIQPKQENQQSSIVITDKIRKQLSDTDKDTLENTKIIIYNATDDEYYTTFNINILNTSITHFNSVTEKMITVMESIISKRKPDFTDIDKFAIASDKYSFGDLTDDDFDIHYTGTKKSKLFPLDNDYSNKDKINIEKQIKKLEETIKKFNDKLNELLKIEIDDTYYMDKQALSEIFNNIQKVQKKMSDFIKDLNFVNGKLATIEKILLNESEKMINVSTRAELTISNNIIETHSKKLNKDGKIAKFKEYLAYGMKDKESIPSPEILKKFINFYTFSNTAAYTKPLKSEISYDACVTCGGYLLLIDAILDVIDYKEDIIDDYKKDIADLYDKIYNNYIEQINSLLNDIKDFNNNTKNINEETYNEFIKEKSGINSTTRFLYHYNENRPANGQFKYYIEDLKKLNKKLEKIKNTFGIK